MNHLFPCKTKMTVGGVMLFLLFVTSPTMANDKLVDTMKTIELRLGARIGFAMRDYANGRTWKYKANQRFPISSTFKPFLCGAVLKNMEQGQERLDHMISIRRDDLVTWSPVTKKHVGASLTVRKLCHAAITMSDNSAANLLLRRIGGPEGFNRFMRLLGDATTRLDRWETKLNEGATNDPRDTTTPDAILKSLYTLIYGNLLPKNRRKQLIAWLKDDQVADALFRASPPSGWEIGDKSGAGGHGSRSIIAIIWPPKDGPVLAALYLTETKADIHIRNKAVAKIGAAVVSAIRSEDKTP